MTFAVIATQRRYRVKMKRGQPFASIILKAPARRVFKERFETAGGGEAFKTLLQNADVFHHPREIPGTTVYAVVPVHELS